MSLLGEPDNLLLSFYGLLPPSSSLAPTGQLSSFSLRAWNLSFPFPFCCRQTATCRSEAWAAVDVFLQLLSVPV